jgi:hypothetical protein
MNRRQLTTVVAAAAVGLASFGMGGGGYGYNSSQGFKAKVNPRGRRKTYAHKPKQRKPITEGTYRQVKKRMALKSRKINRGVW